MDSGFSNQQMSSAWAFPIGQSRLGPAARVSERALVRAPLAWGGTGRASVGLRGPVVSALPGTMLRGQDLQPWPFGSLHCPHPPGEPGVPGGALRATEGPSTLPVTHCTTGPGPAQPPGSHTPDGRIPAPGLRLQGAVSAAGSLEGAASLLTMSASEIRSHLAATLNAGGLGGLCFLQGGLLSPGLKATLR